MKIDVSLLSKYNCKIKTDSGYQVVTKTFIKSEKCYELHFSDWTILKVAENHLFELSSGEWKFAKDLADTDVVLCEQGEASIINKIDVGMQTVYDLTVDTNKHQYYLDGISSHNTGKNLIISSACCALMDRKSSPHEGIVYIRSNIDSIETKDQELGFLPGAIGEKMAPYLRPLKDTIDTLVRSKYKVAISKDREALDAKIEEFNEKYNISFEAMNFLRGGTIKNSLIIIDECLSEGSILHTEEGKMSIETIVSKISKGESIKVLSYNFNTNAQEMKALNNIKVEEFKPDKDKMYEIELEDGSMITVTGNHKLYINGEYRKVSDCLDGSEYYLYK